MPTSDTITWLHMSDLHFRTKETPEKTNARLAMLDDIKYQMHESHLRPDFIVISGDIAYSGKREEYHLAQQFLDSLLEISNITKNQLFLVPGNHDVDLSEIGALSSHAVSILNSPAIVDDFLARSIDREVVFRRLRNYSEFTSHYFDKTQPVDKDAYFYTRHIDLAGLRIGILGLNSAWLAGQQFDKGRLVVGEFQVRTALNRVQDANLRIAVVHHPFDWLAEFDSASTQRLLLTNCDFVLHGHMHQKGLLQGLTAENRALVVAAGTGHDQRDIAEAYNLVQLHRTQGFGTIFLRSYGTARGGMWVPDTVSYLNVPDGKYVFELPSSWLATKSRVTKARALPGESLFRTKPQVFLSYAREDFEQVEGLYDALERAGFNPWIDKRNLLPGQRWRDALERSLKQSDFLLVCLSRRSINRRGFFQREMHMALELWQQRLPDDIFLIPVRLEECEVPESLTDFQWLDLFHEDGWKQLRAALETGSARRGIVVEPVLDTIAPYEPERESPSGFDLESRCSGHDDVITRLVWSSDGLNLISASHDHTLRRWNADSGVEERVFEGHSDWVNDVAITADGLRLVSASRDNTVRVWDLHTGTPLQVFSEHRSSVDAIAVTPDGSRIVSGSWDGAIHVWDEETEQPLATHEQYKTGVRALRITNDNNRVAIGFYDGNIEVRTLIEGKTLNVLRGHSREVTSLDLTSDGTLLASASADHTISIWEIESGKQLAVLTGHTGPVTSVSFSGDQRLLASKSHDKSVRLWACGTWQEVAALPESHSNLLFPSVAFNRRRPILATLGEHDRVIRIWNLREETILPEAAETQSWQYLSARAVLLGRSGVGKSCLGLRLAGDDYLPQDSTHGARFWQIQITEDQARTIGFSDDTKLELVLWDLAGQPEYRIVHQLFLGDVDVALLLFDCSDPTDPFGSIHFWAKVLKKQAPTHVRRLLVSSRCDVCPVTVDRHEITRIMALYDLDGYLRTSAKTGVGVNDLLEGLIRTVPWDRLPRTTTPALFQTIREYILGHKEAGNNLADLDGILNAIRLGEDDASISRDAVEEVVNILQTKGIVYRFDPTPSKSWILLQPSYVNQYASSVIQAARSHPMGIGAVPEHQVMRSEIELQGFGRLGDLEEKIVLESVVELLIKRGLCFREIGLLVFPSQVSLTETDSPEILGDNVRKEVAYRFSGSIEAIYASLVVYLTYTNEFERVAQWRFAATFTCNGHRLGFKMESIDEGTGEIVLFFETAVSLADRITFVRFVRSHLSTHGIELKERTILYCVRCGREISNQHAIETRLSEGYRDIPCQYCGSLVLIPESVEQYYYSDKGIDRVEDRQQLMMEIVQKRAKHEAETFRDDQRRYTTEQDPPIRILHLSDIRMKNRSEAEKYWAQLDTDLRRELGINRLHFLVVSGDIANKALPLEYEAAYFLVDNLMRRYGLDPSRVVAVPGNHDVSWSLSRNAYSPVYEDELQEPLRDGTYVSAVEDVLFVRNEEAYQRRFDHFNDHFYSKVCLGMSYPKGFVDQAVFYSNAEDHILFLGLNSAWEVDHFKPHRSRSSINMGSLAKALSSMENQLDSDWLKIAVWHHPVTGKQMMNDEFMELLATSGFQICLHGHVQEAKSDYFRYDWRGIHLVGAGTFGAPAEDLARGIPLQYSLLEINPSTRTVKVQTRKKEKPDGAWSADARWGDKNNPVPWYEIQLQNWTFSGKGTR